MTGGGHAFAGRGRFRRASPTRSFARTRSGASRRCSPKSSRLSAGCSDAGEYTGALASLAGLRDGVDAFFDTVKVMDEDEKLRGNRLALLARIGALFMETADISLLQPANE